MIIDLIIIILVLLGAFAGFKKGLVGILVSLIGLIIAIALAFMLQIPVANYLNENTGIGKSINTTITKGINDAISNQNKSEENKDEIQNSKTSDFYQSIIGEVTNDDQIAELANNTTLFLLKGISFIGIFIVTIIIFYIIQMILNLVFNLPILDIVNKIGGIAAGALKSVISIWILLAIISFLAPIPFMNSIVTMVSTSTLGNFLYTHNLFVTLIIATIQKS